MEKIVIMGRRILLHECYFEIKCDMDLAGISLLVMYTNRKI